MIHDDDVDLRYLQCESFLYELQKPRVRARNLFLPRMAKNLQPGFVGQLDLETIAAVLDGAANVRPGRVIHARLTFQGDCALMEICAIRRDMVSICADMSRHLLPALHWYRTQGDSHLYVAVAAPFLFWLPLTTGTPCRE